MCMKYVFIHADQITVLPRQHINKHHICMHETHYLINLTVAMVTDICHHLP